MFENWALAGLTIYNLEVAGSIPQPLRSHYSSIDKSFTHTYLYSSTTCGIGQRRWPYKAGKVTAGRAESNGSLLLGLWQNYNLWSVDCLPGKPMTISAVCDR